MWVQLVEWKGQLFAIGGHDDPTPSGLKDTVERFDDNTQQWLYLFGVLWYAGGWAVSGRAGGVWEIIQ